MPKLITAQKSACLTLLSLALVGAVITGCPAKENKTSGDDARAQIHSPPDFEITLGDFVSAFKADAAATTTKYKNKTVRFSGTVKSLTRPHGLNTSQGLSLEEVTPSDGFDTNLGVIFLDEDDDDTKARYQKLKAGDVVTLDCMYKDAGALMLMMHCLFGDRA